MNFSIWELIRSVTIGILLGFMIPTLKDRFGKWWFGVLVLICLVLNIIVNVIGYLI